MRPLEAGTDQRISGGAGRNLPDHPDLEGAEQGCCSGLLGEVGDTAKTAERVRSERRLPGTGKPRIGDRNRGSELGFHG